MFITNNMMFNKCLNIDLKISFDYINNQSLPNKQVRNISIYDNCVYMLLRSTIFRKILYITFLHLPPRSRTQGTRWKLRLLQKLLRSFSTWQRYPVTFFQWMLCAKYKQLLQLQANNIKKKRSCAVIETSELLSVYQRNIKKCCKNIFTYCWFEKLVAFY